MELNDRVKFAKQFASALHADQRQLYDDGQPYSVHLDFVHDTLLLFDFIDRDILAAAYLHDVVEDTKIDQSVISSLFGGKIATLVWAVTDEPGKNRKERKAATYPKIKATPGATALKLADRIANVKYAVDTKNVRMLKMYRQEQPDFELQLRVVGDLDRMWNHLGVLLLSE